MSNDVRETKFRLMVTARVFSKKPSGTITQMFIDDVVVGTLPEDKMSGEQQAFVGRNSAGLTAAAAMCMLAIANAKTDKEKKKAAQMSFGQGDVPSNAPAAEVKKLADAALESGRAPVIPDKNEG